jgi:hypothetical protein
MVSLPLSMHEAAYGGNSFICLGWHPPGRCQRCAADSDPFGRQSNLKLAEDNKIPKAVLCIVAMMLSYWIIGLAGSTTRLNSDSVTKPSFSAAAFFGRDRGQFATCNRLFQIRSETGTIEINGSIVRG